MLGKRGFHSSQTQKSIPPSFSIQYFRLNDFRLTNKKKYNLLTQNKRNIMENKRQMGINSSPSSLTMDLFGPKHPLPSSMPSSGHFDTVFGPPFPGQLTDSSHGVPMREKELGNQYGKGKHGNSGTTTQTHNKAIEPCYFSSSIYYGGQEVYSPTGHTLPPKHTFKKDDANGSNSNSASRGNWWQGSLYY